MLNLPLLRNTIVSLLYPELGRPVIRSDQDGDVPEYPYVAYSITSPYIDQYGHDVEVYANTDAGFEKEQSKQIETVFSFTAYAEDEDEAMAVCLQIIEYVNRTGREALQDAGFVIVSTSDVQNRSVLLVEHYERRWGVDVRFRSVDRSVTIDETGGYIERAEITERGG